MNVLIADSGGSKTDWTFLQNGRVVQESQTIGFNPYFLTKENIRDEIQKTLLPKLEQAKLKADAVHFYGTGCSTKKNCDLVAGAISEGLGVKETEVTHDLLGAARALCGHEPGIAAILGTGSNSCLYDGKNILENVPSVGYLWSDYGGGSQIGKFFIRDYFEGRLPNDIQKKFEAAGYSRDVILESVYKSPMPSGYLAQVSRFTQENLEHPHIKKVLTECFSSFFTQYIQKYSHSKNYKIGMVGSVAFVYQDFIRSVAHNFGYEIGRVMKSPMAGLIEFHCQS